MKVFVYGTLRKGFHNHDYMNGATFLGSARTGAKYHLFVSGIPFVSKKGEFPSNIVGEVYDVPVSEMKNLDRLEGHPRWYRRERVRVILENGTRTRAWLYFNTPRGKEISSGDFNDVYVF